MSDGIWGERAKRGLAQRVDRCPNSWVNYWHTLRLLCRLGLGLDLLLANL